MEEVVYDIRKRAFVDERGRMLTAAEVAEIPARTRARLMREARAEVRRRRTVGAAAAVAAVAATRLFWDKVKKVYFDIRFRVIPAPNIRFVIDDFTQTVAGQMEKVTRELIAGKIEIANWQVRSKNILKAAYLDADAAARGGLRNLTARDMAKVAARNRKQFGYLNNFAKQMKAGTVSEKQAIARARSYASAIRSNYEQARQDMLNSEFPYSRRVLHAKESCSECLSWAAKGFVPSETQPPVGTLLCGQHCRCTIEFTDNPDD